MRLAPPSPEHEFALIIYDVDRDGPEISYFRDLADARDAALDEYGGSDGEPYPDTTEPGGNKYADDETPNAIVMIVHVLARSIL